MQIAFTQTIEETRGDGIYLVHGGVDHTGQSSWYFIRVENPKVRAFLKAIKDGAINLSGYGEIIESGYGKEPPYSVLERMRSQYGYMG